MTLCDSTMSLSSSRESSTMSRSNSSNSFSVMNSQSEDVNSCRLSRQMKNLKLKQVNKIHNSCHVIPLNVLDELAARFLINIPLEEREDLIRVCFQVELAHWFYIDFYLPKDPTLVEGSMNEFAAHMFHHVPFLQKYSNEVDQVVERWSEYKVSVPVNGAIILNTTLDKVLMVQGFNKKSGWAFPKGKVNEGEEPHDCAAREVFEETGFDVGQLIHKQLYLEQVVNNQTVRLYLVAGVSEKIEFCPRLRGEISSIQWWDLASLPTRVGDKSTKDRLGLSPHMFYNVIPFIRGVRKWAAGQTKTIRNEYNYNFGEMPLKAAREVTKNSEMVESVNRQNKDRVKMKLFVDNKLETPDIKNDIFYPPSWQNFKLDLDQIEHHVQRETTEHLNSGKILDFCSTETSSWQHFIHQVTVQSQINNQTQVNNQTKKLDNQRQIVTQSSEYCGYSPIGL